MITKVITNSFEFGEIAASLVPIHSRGIDSGYMKKHANFQGVFADTIANLKPRKGRTIIHVIALGDEEIYGPNRNGDGFSREDNVTAHKSFKDIGHTFKNHKNDDPFKAVGQVMATAHNANMSRVQLLLDLDNDKCQREVDALDRGEDVPVSMGCFTAGHQLTLDDGTTICLEDAKLGDVVLTHSGARKQITHVFEEKVYTGDLYTISAKTVPSIEATEEHPFFVVKQDKLVKTTHKNRRVDKTALENVSVIDDAEWVAAKDLVPGDYLVTPINLDVETADYLSQSLMRMLGYYLAEGHIRMTSAGSYCGVQFSLHKDDAAVTEIPRLCEQLGISASAIRFFDSNVSKKVQYISVTDSELAYRCAELCGVGARTKRLSRELMLADPKLQLEFLGAYINGDGCAGSNCQAGALYISTSSDYLRDQVRQVLGRVGVMPGVNTITHKAGKGKNTYNTVEHQLYIPKTDASILAPYTVKGIRAQKTDRRGGRRIKLNGFFLTPIDHIESTQVEDEPIYNIEVEGDNSYVINGVAVHNSMQDYDVCSICKHKAPTAADHCQHIKTMLGQLLADGRKVYMQNPKPKYFDISLVYKPADRIAYTLQKVASGGSGVIGGHELAEVYGLRPITDPKYAALRSLASIYKQIPTHLRKVTEPAPLKSDTVTELKKQAKVHGIDHLLAFLHANGWMVGPQDFGDVIGHSNPGGCAQAVEDYPVIGELLDDHTNVKALEVPSSPNYISLSESARGDLESSCGMRDDTCRNRAIRISIIKPVKTAAKHILDENEAMGFASLYGHYKLAFAAQHLKDYGLIHSVAGTF